MPKKNQSNQRIKNLISSLGTNFSADVLPFLEKMAKEKDIKDEVIINFAKLFYKFKTNPAGKITWAKIKNISTKDYIDYKKIKNNKTYINLGKKLLSETIFLKLNGGLGTTMGLHFTKSKIVVDMKNQKSFLDIIKDHVLNINKSGTHIDFWLLNSFNTSAETREILNFPTSNFCPFNELIQTKFPRIEITKNKTKTPLFKPLKFPSNPPSEWNPPGHGDIYQSLKINNLLTHFIKAGKKYLFISNSDNLGATLDYAILGYMAAHKLDFIMEVTPKTLADKKGGIVIRYDDRLFLLERAQVPEEHLDDFENIKKFKFFNTNNIWLNLETLAKKMRTDFSLPLIINKKPVNGHTIAQLETAMGAAIKHFERSILLQVPRSRFLPAKTNEDILLLRSDYTKKIKGSLIINPKRKIPKITPKITFSKNYYNFLDFEKQIQNIPSLINIENLILDGAINLKGKKTISFAGNVAIFASDNILVELQSPLKLTNIKIIIYQSQTAATPYPSHLKKRHTKITSLKIIQSKNKIIITQK